MSNQLKQHLSGRRLLAVALSVLMVLSVVPVISFTTAPQAEAYGTYNKVYNDEYYYPSGTQFISHLIIYFSSSSNGDAEDNIRSRGYIPWGHNFNAGDGHSSKYIHSGYKTTTDPTAAIKGILIATGHPESVSYNGATYYKPGAAPHMPQDGDWNDCDLNKGNGGDDLYLMATVDRAAGPALTSLSMGQNKNSDTAKSNLTNSGYTVATNQSGGAQDTNSGAGGDFNYVGYKSACVKLNSDLLRVEYNYALARYNGSDYGAKYTQASRTVLQNALSTAEGLLRDLNDGYTTSNQTTINNATNALTNARNGLALNTYTVTFRGYTSGTTLGTLKTETVSYGGSATAPSSVSKTSDANNHYTFNSWSGGFTNVKSNLTITAIYNSKAHEYRSIQYNWAQNGSSCAASAVCTSCGYVKNANGTVTSAVKTPATCAAMGTTTYTAAFSAPFTTQNKELQDIAINPSNHTGGTELRDYDPANCLYDGYSGDTYCKGCGVKLATGSVIPSTGNHGWELDHVTVPATCMRDGEGVERCDGCGSTRTVVLPALGHDLGEPTYTWAADCSTCQGVRICANCRGRYAAEATVTHGETGEGNCVTKGATTYTAVFSDDHFTTQTKDVYDGEINADIHTGNTEVRGISEPSCGIAGYTGDTFCADCGAKLADGEEIAATGAHTWDEGVITTDPTCTEKGVKTFTCSGCGTTRTEDVPANGHVPADKVIENNVEPTCQAAGSYDEVVYCTVCGDELSRETVDVEALPHTPAEAVTENEDAGDCETKASYDSVIYCSVCGDEISRETIETELGDHVPGEPVRENVNEATCRADGSYEEVVYCTVCGDELSRETKTIAAGRHTPGELIKENVVDASCSAEGSYDAVVYCTVCENEVLREHVVVPKKNHVANPPVEENEVAPSCTAAGSYDEVVYCYVCGEEISRETKTLAMTEHDWDEGKVTKEPTASSAGEKTYTCAICGETKTEELPAEGSCPLCHKDHDAGLIDVIIGLFHRLFYTLTNLLKKV